MIADKIHSPEVAAVYNSYPKDIRNCLIKLRELIFAIGNKIDYIGTVEESLKWGDPSYSTILGSTIRLGLYKKDPERYAIYFHCQTKLISTFRKLYPKTLSFDGNRAIVFQKNERVPKKALEQCIELALTYHRRKNKPMLGTQKE